jgi:AcrR family transcriptional regulator
MTGPPNPQRRNEASRRAILDAALQLCAETGYRRVTIEAIAAHAGVSKKTIYRWWPSKGAVVLEAVDDMANLVAEFPDTGDLAADLHTQITAVIRLLTPPQTSAITGLIAESLQDEALARDLRRLIQLRIEAFNRRLEKAQRDGQLAADADFDVAVDLVYGPIYHRLVYHIGQPDSDELRKLLAHALRALEPAHSQQ